jgi:hypothetical protein
MRWLLSGETKPAELLPWRRLRGSARYLYRLDAATPLAWDGSEPKRREQVLPQDMQSEGPFESSAVEFVPFQLQTFRHQAVWRMKSRGNFSEEFTAL